MAKLPEELVGKRFLEIMDLCSDHSFVLTGNSNQWTANIPWPHDDIWTFRGHGNTPEEAASDLWLALKKENKLPDA